jgi:hypothetical protein
MIRITSLLFLFLFSCGSEFLVSPHKVIEVEVIVEDSGPPVYADPPETEVVVDYFEQPIKPDALDVLFVLDTSCSMRDDYEKLSIGMDLLRTDIETLTNDYQIGIINSSLFHNSSRPFFVGPFDKDTSSIDLILAPALLSNDPYERPFQGHYEFATSTDEGLQFLRPGVDKLTVYISDEDEQSAIPASIFRDWLEDYHADVQYDVVSIAITPTSDLDCAYHEENVGVKFQELMDYYNKNVVDFCGDWQVALADSSFLLSEITHLNLSRTPIEDSIVVYQNGVEETMWYYLSSTNTVYFEFPMIEGSVIKVGYDSLVQ